LSSDSTKWRNLVYSLSAAPVDHLMLGLQLEDARGGILMNLVSPSKNVISQCLQEYTTLLLDSDCKVVSILKHHFAPLGHEAVHAAMMLAFAVILQLSSQVWRQLDTRYKSWPYALVGLVAPGVKAEDRRKLAALFFDIAKECCLDDDFSMKVLLPRVRP
jgi:hypothetical protein